MFTLYKKELANFFSSLIGYITIIVFLVVNGLMIWVLRSSFNILDYGYADMEGFFLVSPFLYWFLIPAITMRMIAEEKKNGTIEFLLTKPIKDMTIIWSKFLAGCTLVLLSLLPTIIYYITVVILGDPVGNIDSGSVMGSYIGLLLLGTAFVAIGLFSSSITNNQIVAFIIAAVFSAFFYLGFESVYNMNILGKAGLFVKGLGMMDHYESMSRGVIDTRDFIYFCSVIALFLMMTRIVLQSRKWHGWHKKKNLMRSNWLEFVAALFIIVFVNAIGRYVFTRLDLTAEHRYSLSDSTKKMIKDVDETMLFRVYLEGENLPADFKRLQNETKEMLNQFRAYNKHIEYEFVDPNDFPDTPEGNKEKQTFWQNLYKSGIQPQQAVEEGSGNSITQLVIWPAATLIYKGEETTTSLLQPLMDEAMGMSRASQVNNAINDLEYQLSNAIHRLSKGQKPRIGFATGHGEIDRGNIYNMQMALAEDCVIENVEIDSNVNCLVTTMLTADSTYQRMNKFDVLVIAKPRTTFSDKSLYIIDQFVMYGGRILWLIDPLDADMDSLQNAPQFMATRYPLNLDEMLFTYGVRVNSDLIMDIRSRQIPMAVGNIGGRPQYRFFPWFYFPEIVAKGTNPIVKNLNPLKTEFVSSIDLIDNGIQKTILLSTSEYTRVKNAPAMIDLGECNQEPDQRLYNRSNLPVAVLLEGKFQSMWRSRLTPAWTSRKEIGYRSESDSTKMIVISDGDMIKNQYNYETGMGKPLGFDQYTGVMYSNKDFLLNCINYLVGDEAMISTRSRSVEIRKLDTMKIENHRLAYQLLNILLPGLLVIIAGIAIFFIRRNRFKSKH